MSFVAGNAVNVDDTGSELRKKTERESSELRKKMERAPLSSAFKESLLSDQLSIRSQNALWEGGIVSLSHLRNLTERQVSMIRGIGVRGLEEIKRVCHRCGIEMKPPTEKEEALRRAHSRHWTPERRKAQSERMKKVNREKRDIAKRMKEAPTEEWDRERLSQLHETEMRQHLDRFADVDTGEEQVHEERDRERLSKLHESEMRQHLTRFADVDTSLNGEEQVHEERDRERVSQSLHATHLQHALHETELTSFADVDTSLNGEELAEKVATATVMDGWTYANGLLNSCHSDASVAIVIIKLLSDIQKGKISA